MDARLRARIVGLKTGAKISIKCSVYDPDRTAYPLGACEIYSPFYALRIGPWWYVFHGFRGPCQVIAAGRSAQTIRLTLLEIKPSTVRISNRLAQLVAKDRAKQARIDARRRKRTHPCSCPGCTRAWAQGTRYGR